MTLSDADFERALMALPIACALCSCDIVDGDYHFDGDDVICRRCHERKIDQAEAWGEGDR